MSEAVEGRSVTWSRHYVSLAAYTLALREAPVS